MAPRVHIGLVLAATLSACAPPTSSSKQATQARSSTAPAPDQAPAPAPPAACVTASGTPKPEFVGARYGSLLVRENAHAIDACLAQARCSVGRFQMTFDVESDGAIADVVLNVGSLLQTTERTHASQLSGHRRLRDLRVQIVK